MKAKFLFISLVSLSVALFLSCKVETKPSFDLIIRNGQIYDGSGGKPFTGDIGIREDKIEEIGKLSGSTAKKEIDAHGLAVAPGFINMLSWAGEGLIMHGRSESDIRQGVTLEVLGEGNSMGPLNESMKKQMVQFSSDLKLAVERWATLGEFFDFLEKNGVSCNVASSVGATTVRINVLGQENRDPTPEELEKMKQLVAQAMEEGATGVSSSLIYAPANFAKTEELIELCKVAAKYDGLYTSHLRSEGDAWSDALDEFTKIRSEVFHLKAAGETNWKKLDATIQKIEKAQAEGLQITADMYNYIAASTGLNAMMPLWVQEGGFAKWAERLKDPANRKRLIKEISTPSDKWENFYVGSGSPEKILVVGFKNEKLKPLSGKTLAQVAALRKTSPIEAAMDLVIEDGSRVQAIYFLMSEENVRKQIKLPWMSFCSDSPSFYIIPGKPKDSTHPRGYGSFARLLGKYVRDEKIISLEEAIRRLTSFPAATLKIRERGTLKPGYFADVVVFDPAKIQDNATFEDPHQYATGMVHVFVNGTQVLDNGEHTGAKPGRIVRGPGWKKK
jgi:N-acyl-D-amino-acid deacylase